ncbi:MAG TPA: ABC transporter permease subunit [Chthonomonadaceae bacterium]|nr:ABC transporter permease subunit [Chthonomonadaceae bacterium]
MNVNPPMIPPIPTPPGAPQESVVPNSPIADLSYRNYDGPLRPPIFRWWTVCRMSLRLLWKKPWFWGIAAICLFPYLIHAIFYYFAGSVTIQILAIQFPELADLPSFKFPLQMYSAFTGNINSIILLTIALLAGAGSTSIAADNQANALQVYLSKPIGKGDYLLGKWMCIFLSVFVVAAIPAISLYLFFLTVYATQGFLHDAPWLWLQTLAVTLLPAAFHASLLVGIAAWSRSPRMVTAIYAGLNFITYVMAPVLGRILSHVYHRDTWQNLLITHASLQGILDGLAQNIFHMPDVNLLFIRREPHLTPMPPLWPLVIASLVLMGISLAAARAKIHAVEVVKG